MKARAWLKSLLLLTLSSATITGCRPPSGQHRPIANDAQEKPLAGGEVPGYDKVKPIFAQYCSGCHPSRSKPDWLDYNQAHAYAVSGLLLKRAVREKSMPLAGSPQAAAITGADRALLGAWAKAGGPEHSGQSGAAAGTPSTPPDSSPANALVQQCTSCHGPDGAGNSAQAKIPRLAGQSADYLKKQISDFKWRRRVDPTNTMNEIALGLSDAQIAEAAAFFAAKPGLGGTSKPASSTHDRAVLEHGQKIAEDTCFACHSLPRPSDTQIPVLAGQSEMYLLNQIIYFRAGQRSNEMMSPIAHDLKDEDIAALALFFSTL